MNNEEKIQKPGSLIGDFKFLTTEYPSDVLSTDHTNINIPKLAQRLTPAVVEALLDTPDDKLNSLAIRVKEYLGVLRKRD